MLIKEYQEDAINCFLKSKQGLLIELQPGSGKSLILYNIFKKFREKNKLDKLVLISKFNVLCEHEESITQYYPEYKINFLDAKKVKFDRNADVYLITPTQVKNFTLSLASIFPKLLCIDESHIYKNPKAKTTKAALVLSRMLKCKKLLMTGTPFIESLLEVQPQMEIISPSIVGDIRTFYKNYTKTVELFPGSDIRVQEICKPELVKKRIAPYIFTYENIELPTQIIKDIGVDMSPKLKKAYKKLKEQFLFELESGENIVDTDYTWINLVQLCSGFYSDRVAEEKIWVCKNKQNKLIKFVEDIDEQVIIWSVHVPELEYLGSKIKDSKLIYGAVKRNERKYIISEFKKGKIKYLIANPACLAEGNSFQNCRYMVYASVPASGNKYIQSLARTNRLSQTRQEYIYRFYHRNSLERTVITSVENKDFTQKQILRSIRYEREYGSKKIEEILGEEV